MNNKVVKAVEFLNRWCFMLTIGSFVTAALHPVIYFILSFVINLQENGRNGQGFLIKGTVFWVVEGCVCGFIYLVCIFIKKHVKGDMLP